MPAVRAAQPLSPGPPVAALRPRPPAIRPAPTLHATARKPRARHATWPCCTAQHAQGLTIAASTHTNTLAGLAAAAAGSTTPWHRTMPRPRPPARRFATPPHTCTPLLQPCTHCLLHTWPCYALPTRARPHEARCRGRARTRTAHAAHARAARTPPAILPSAGLLPRWHQKGSLSAGLRLCRTNRLTRTNLGR